MFYAARFTATFLSSFRNFCQSHAQWKKEWTLEYASVHAGPSLSPSLRSCFCQPPAYWAREKSAVGSAQKRLAGSHPLKDSYPSHADWLSKACANLRRSNLSECNLQADAGIQRGRNSACTENHNLQHSSIDNLCLLILELGSPELWLWGLKQNRVFDAEFVRPRRSRWTYRRLNHGPMHGIPWVIRSDIPRWIPAKTFVHILLNGTLNLCNGAIPAKPKDRCNLMHFL